jgi:putative ABC transport system permease protein
VQGRLPRPGLREAITSRSLARRFAGAGLNEDLAMLDTTFRIVGLFEAGESSAESEVWTDLKVLGQAGQRGSTLSSVQLRAASAASLAAIKDRLVNDEQFALKALVEPDYFKEQAIAGLAIKIVGRLIAFFLTLGAMFAVANTMFAAVASRAREIGTLRALGFSRSNVLASFMIESLVLCLLGGALGCLGTLPVNGLSTGTANWQTFSEITFSFRFGPSVLLQGTLLAIVMGMLGGLFPAIRSTRMRIVDALREV